MKNGISIGIAIGMIIGAFTVNNCSSVRTLVDDTQRKVKSKMQKAGSVVMNNCECSHETGMSGEFACDANMSSIPDGQTGDMMAE